MMMISLYSTPMPESGLGHNASSHPAEDVGSRKCKDDDRDSDDFVVCDGESSSDADNEILERRDIGSIVPLLQLLPALTIEDNRYILNDTITQSDVQRLKLEAHKVRSFKHSGDLSPSVDPSIFFRLALLLKEPLFPSLRQLRLPSIGESLTHIFLFLSPSLQIVEMGDISYSAIRIATSFLAALPSEAPRLSHLVLRGPLKLGVTALVPISHLTQLRSLELFDVVVLDNFNLLSRLGRLTNLETFVLQLDTQSLNYCSPDHKTLPAGTFAKLRTLGVTATFSLINDLLHAISSDGLTVLRIQPLIVELVTRKKKGRKERSLPTPTLEQLVPCKMKEMFEIISSKWSQGVLSLYLDMLDTRASYGRTQTFNLLEEVIASLASLSNLETLHIKKWGIENLDYHIKQLAPSWKKIRELEFPLHRSNNTIGLGALRIIAASCPHLHSLQICIEPLSVTSLTNDMASYVLNHGLRKLSVGSSSGSKALDAGQRRFIARYLSVVFPVLTTMETHPGRNKEEWDLVHELLRMLQEVRRDDMNRNLQK